MTATANAQVGFVLIRDKGPDGKPETYQVPQEVAAWRTVLKGEVGRYPMILSGSGCGFNPYFVGAEVPAVVIENFTPSLFGGVMVGSRDGSESVGHKSSFVRGLPLRRALLDTRFLFNDEETWRELANLVLPELKRSAEWHAQYILDNIKKGKYDATANVVDLCREIQNIERTMNDGYIKYHIVGGENDELVV